MVSIERLGDTADRPVRVRLSPNCLTQSQSGLQSRGCAQEHAIACDRAGIIILHDGQPGTGGLAVCVEDKEIELGVIRLPDRIGALSAVPVDQLVAVTIGGWTLMDEAQHGWIKRSHHPAHCRV